MVKLLEPLSSPAGATKSDPESGAFVGRRVPSATLIALQKADRSDIRFNHVKPQLKPKISNILSLKMMVFIFKLAFSLILHS